MSALVEVVQIDGQRQQDDGALRPRRVGKEHRSCSQTSSLITTTVTSDTLRASCDVCNKATTLQSACGRLRTCERLKDEEREHHLAEDALEQPAAGLVAPLEEVQHCGRNKLRGVLSS